MAYSSGSSYAHYSSQTSCLLSRPTRSAPSSPRSSAILRRQRPWALQAEIDDYRHRATLMDPRRLDPDIVTERARSLLNMANTDDIIVMVDRATGKPISSKFSELTSDELTSIIEADSTL